MSSFTSISCSVCSAACCHSHFYPGCDSTAPGRPVSESVVDCFHDDFFGQFINHFNVRTLNNILFQRFLDARIVLCPECGHQLPLNPVSNDYLQCVFCHTHFDLLRFRPATASVVTLSKMRADGTYYRRRVPATDQMDISF